MGSANGAAAGELVRLSASERAAPVSCAPSSCIRRKASAPLNGGAAGSSRSAMDGPPVRDRRETTAGVRARYAKRYARRDGPQPDAVGGRGRAVADAT